MAKTPPKAAPKSGKTPNKKPPTSSATPAQKGSTLGNLLGNLTGGKKPTSPSNAGTTAHKEQLTPEGPLAELAESLGKTTTYTGCSACRKNLDQFSKQKNIPLHKINICPGCRATFVKQADVHCYCCSTIMVNGQCLNCEASQRDDEDLKVATVHYRMTRGLHGEDARMQANQLLATKGPTRTTVLADGRTDRIVQAVETNGIVPVAQLQHRPQQQPSYPNNGSNWGAPRRSNGDDPLS